MAIDALQHYVQLANGLTKTTRERALAAARAALSQVGLEDVATDASERVSKLADDIMHASRANRQLLTDFVAHEVDQAVHRLGLVRLEDLEELRAEVARLRSSVDPSAPRDTTRKRAQTASTDQPSAGSPRARKAGTRKAPAATPSETGTPTTAADMDDAAEATEASASAQGPADATPLPEETS
jgi:polyhydroxyalkanoate synthesis regulator phasin